jgi:hypothetical protein
MPVHVGQPDVAEDGIRLELPRGRDPGTAFTSHAHFMASARCAVALRAALAEAIARGDLAHAREALEEFIAASRPGGRKKGSSSPIPFSPGL